MLSTCSARNLPSASSARRRGRQMIPRLMVRQKRLRPRGDPFHRPPGPPRGPQDQRVLRIGEILGAETAADIRRDEPHLRRFDPQRARGHVAIAVQVLAGQMQRVAAVVQPDGPARLHRIGHDPVVVQRRSSRHAARSAARPRPRPAGPSASPGTDCREPPRSAAARPAPTASCARVTARQRIILHVDPFGRIQRLMAGLRHDQRDRLSDIAHRVSRQQRLRQKAKRLVGLHIGLDRRPQRLQPIGVGLRARSARR